MRRAARGTSSLECPLLTLLCVLGLLCMAPLAAQTEAPPPQGEAIDPTTREALDRLATQLADKRAERKLAQGSPDVARAAALDAEIRALGWQFAALTSRLDVQQFEAPQARSFDLRAEVEELIRPLIQTLKDATEEPRQIAELTERIAGLESRRRTVETAQRAVERMRDRLPAGSPARAEAERELAERWRPTLDALRGEIVILQARKLAREQQQQSLWARATDATRSFVQNSGLNVLLSGAVFVSVLFLVRWLQSRLMQRRGHDRGFSLRLLEVALQALGIVLAVLATMVVPYVRNDWLLLAVGIVFLLGVGWVLVRTLPQFFEQIRLVLNVGGVREGERIVVDGLPFRVDQLRFYTRLVNPDLQGGELRVPIQDLIGKRSRRAAADEPWFPCRTGDVVLLGDGVFGAVQTQTPEVVVIEQFGSPRSYPTTAFLAQSPRNLSRGFLVDATFGLDYRHQRDVATIAARLQQALHDGLAALVPAGQLRRVDVQFAAAGPSSLDFAAFAEFAGAAAGRFADLRRALQRLGVETCTAHGWTIPFPQLVVHRPTG